MQHVTIKDIARLAGVSVTTVSRALNNAPEIHSDTRERVLAICRQQGYRTNLLARSLISSRSHVLGLILPDISSPFHATLALNIETYAREQGYQVMLCSGRPGDGAIDALIELLLSQRVDGLLLGSSSDAAFALLSRVRSAIPAVLLGACPTEIGAARTNAVSTDNYTGGRMAAEYLARLGHRRAVYLGLRPASTTHRLRHSGFLAEAAACGMAVTTVENTDGSSTIKSGYRMARQVLPQRQETAVFAVSDAVALGVLQVADELGMAVPEQLSVLGYDDIEYAALPNIRLTTIAQNSTLLARSAVRLLLEEIEHEERGLYTSKLITPTLVERSTCAAPGKAP